MSGDAGSVWKRKSLTQDSFLPGTKLWINTNFGDEYEGEVLVFDFPSKLLALKCASSSGLTSQNDIHVINLNYARDVKVLQVTTAAPPGPRSLNINKLDSRFQNEVSMKKNYVQAVAAGVSSEGQLLFSALAKTAEDVSWEGVNIKIFNEVTIIPPYLPDNIKNENSQSYKYIKKLVEKHAKDIRMKRGGNHSDSKVRKYNGNAISRN